MTTESKRLKEEASKYGIPVQSYSMATLMAAGWTAAESYALAYYKNESFSASQNASIRDNIVQNPNFGEIVDKIRASFPPVGSGQVETGSYTIPSKDELAKIIATEMRSLTGKERVDAAMRLADLYAMKKEEVKEEEEKIIHVYLPLTCALCPKNATIDKIAKKKQEIDDAMNVLALHEKWIKFDANMAKKPAEDRPDAIDVVMALSLVMETVESTRIPDSQ